MCSLQPIGVPLLQHNTHHLKLPGNTDQKYLDGEFQVQKPALVTKPTTQDRPTGDPRTKFRR